MTLKKLLNYSLLFIVLMAFSSCGGTRYLMDFSLEKPKPSNDLKYSDEFIDIAFVMGKKAIAFELQNKTDSGIKINWDDCSYVSPDGQTMRVIHTGTKFINKEQAQAPTTVPPRAKCTDQLAPADNVYWSKGYGKSIGSWKQKFMFPGYGSGLQKYSGKKFSLYMPLEIKGQRKEYNFLFDIDVRTVTKK